MQVAKISPLLFVSRCVRCDAISFVESELDALSLEREHHCIEPERPSPGNLIWEIDFDFTDLIARVVDFDFPPDDPASWN